jgi:hypothetical protein
MNSWLIALAIYVLIGTVNLLIMMSSKALREDIFEKCRNAHWDLPLISTGAYLLIVLIGMLLSWPLTYLGGIFKSKE